MIIGLLTFELYLPYAHSLKEKRKTVVSLRDRLKKKYNIAFAELDYQNKWQRSKIGLVTLNSQRKIVESMFQKLIIDIENNLDGELLNVEIHFI